MREVPLEWCASSLLGGVHPPHTEGRRSAYGGGRSAYGGGRSGGEHTEVGGVHMKVGGVQECIWRLGGVQPHLDGPCVCCV